MFFQFSICFGESSVEKVSNGETPPLFTKDLFLSKEVKFDRSTKVDLCSDKVWIGNFLDGC